MSLNAAETLLLIIDVQNDFCPMYFGHKTGALAVPNGNDVVKPLNALSRAITRKGGRVAATQDWHPIGHVSFASSHNGKKPGELINTPAVKGQMLWPDHCVQGTAGAAFHKKLHVDNITFFIRKGFRCQLDSYSAFYENDHKTSTGLEGWIHSLGLKEVILGGLATDYCVFYSAMDCKKLGFNTIIASDAVRGVDIPQGSTASAIEKMKEAGINFISSHELLEELL
jgi:nicotinamidase/pyrazinamidase